MKKTVEKYGVVYTPRLLAVFLAQLMKSFYGYQKEKIDILDPACGELSLLKSIGEVLPNSNLKGIDIDKEILSTDYDGIDLKIDNFILPVNKKDDQSTLSYWLNQGISPQMIIANPPWSSNRIYDSKMLRKSGFEFIHGQYDSYVLFIELALKLLSKDGYLGLIVPDSFFADQNIKLRRYLLENYQVKVVARLGEKIFKHINRATTVLVIRNKKPSHDDMTACFRLNPENRKKVLAEELKMIDLYKKYSFMKPQRNFLNNQDCHISVDTTMDEDIILSKIKENSVKRQEFQYMRGVEISKTGLICTCPICNNSQGFLPNQLKLGKKKCMFCHTVFKLNKDNINKIISKKPIDDWKQIIVGESIHRYETEIDNWIMPDVKGIKYKDILLYQRPKLLIRKTGLGIYASLDKSGAYISQTVHMLYNTNSKEPLEYYLALLNSRVIYYYYLKVYGQTEWKSHPYITKRILLSLPIKKYSGTEVDKCIVDLANKLQVKYNKELDLLLEGLVMDVYKLDLKDRKKIIEEINNLPDLDSINQMKIGV